MLSYYERNREKCIKKSLEYYYKNKDIILKKRKLKNHYYNYKKSRIKYLLNKYNTLNKNIIDILKRENERHVSNINYFSRFENGQKVYYAIPIPPLMNQESQSNNYLKY